MGEGGRGKEGEGEREGERGRRGREGGREGWWCKNKSGKHQFKKL